LNLASVTSRPSKTSFFLSKELTARNGKFVNVGGFAAIEAGYARQTMDIDLLVATGDENERSILASVGKFPDGATREIRCGVRLDREPTVSTCAEHSRGVRRPYPFGQRPVLPPGRTDCLLSCNCKLASGIQFGLFPILRQENVSR